MSEMSEIILFEHKFRLRSDGRDARYNSNKIVLFKRDNMSLMFSSSFHVEINLS